jgi:PEGA domain
MRTKVLLALLALVVMIAVAPVVIAEKTLTSPRADTRVILDSRPDMAEIQVDGKFIGTTPVEYRLSPGVHHLEMTRGNRFSPWVRDLSVGDVPTRVTALLESTENPCPK